ncbi:uncharacterized protein LOC127948384, partial [Carassius gibelio]|uniref:uncharacterized protein LOC127948384 n=1 Tax=Carassius gibelio TaxID=101364 RepID=UPI0022790F72
HGRSYGRQSHSGSVFSFKVESPACSLCSKRGTLEHIFSCSSKALGEGRYRWRHDQVLKAIVETIATGVEWAKRFRLSKQAIAFDRAGELPKPDGKTSAGILATARDWQLLVNLEQQLKFPNHVVITTLRPNIVLLSESTKQVVLLELTVLWEDRLEEAFERKLAKYEGLVSECRQAGWRANRGRMQGLYSLIPGQSLQFVRYGWVEEEKSHPQHQRSSKESLKMAVAKERRSMEEG